jgi:hypothetical protein
MIEVGDKVTWDGKIGTIISINRPACKCKGKGHYMIDVDGVSYKVPVTTKLEKYE